MAQLTSGSSITKSEIQFLKKYAIATRANLENDQSERREKHPDRNPFWPINARRASHCLRHSACRRSQGWAAARLAQADEGGQTLMLILLLNDLTDWGAGRFKAGMVLVAERRAAMLWIARGDARALRPGLDLPGVDRLNIFRAPPKNPGPSAEVGGSRLRATETFF
jgi:hypothetical protein